MRAVAPPTLVRYARAGSRRPAEVAAPRCTTASAPSTAGRRLEGTARSPGTTSTGGMGGAAGRRRTIKRGRCPAATSRGTSAVPIKPVAPVTTILGTGNLPALLPVQLAELLVGEAGPAVPWIGGDHVTEPVLGLAQAAELSQGQADVVVALGHPDAVGKAIDHLLVAGKRGSGIAGAEQARRTEEGRVGGGIRLAGEEDGALEVPPRCCVVLPLESLPPALVVVRRAEVVGHVPGCGREDRDHHAPDQVRLRSGQRARSCP